LHAFCESEMKKSMALACFFAERWGDLIKEFNTASTFLDVLAVQGLPLLFLSSVDPVSLKLSTQQWIVLRLRTGSYRPRPSVVCRARCVLICDSQFWKKTLQLAHVIYPTKAWLILKMAKSRLYNAHNSTPLFPPQPA